ncbi:hypothetical protein NE686_17990 [Tissierella carlieri]|uniref:DUF551 domain-containing protein n=1 Tax=Tissierella carlieri TaxID=689904 RepID=A0ABT1SF54_9FIRM|nr:hypothetical protein [Tissierella carlieri]MCQ4924997.1 hypothetical protein [Tissierella carlieri]
MKCTVTKWIPIVEDYKLHDTAIVTRKINKNELDVTIGLPGWGLENNTIAYMPLPANINEDRSLWKSEYFGDYLPDKDGWYIVQLQGVDLNRWFYNKLVIVKLYYASNKCNWLAVPQGWEVVGWMEFPKPYKVKSTV